MKTGRIGFSKWTKEDAAFACSLWGDREVARFICSTSKFSKQDVQKRLALEIENSVRFHVQYWPIFSLEDGEFLGCCGLRPHDMEKGVYELGFHLKQEHWGKGYATEAAGAVINYAFDVLGVDNLVAGHHPPKHRFSKGSFEAGLSQNRRCLLPSHRASSCRLSLPSARLTNK